MLGFMSEQFNDSKGIISDHKRKKKTKGLAMIYKTLHRKQKIE